ncbi:MAG: ROK family protein [Candidatus Eisenbacteria bacterium]|nr:ROK family protein [Candidatus Eisenbacteria bacterium]MCC7144769.1 ROK family protein [Candidatus Eisenbacteria bacterium]
MRIGIDLGGTKIEGIVLGADGRECARRRIPTPRGDYEGTLRAIASLALELEAASGERCSIGLGTPGAVSPASGRMKNCNSTWLNGRLLKEDLEARLKRVVRLANDANCFALSEAIDGAGVGAETVFGVILGTGCGGGVVVRQQLLSGRNAIAGEWGHNPLPWPRDEERPGTLCYCGLSGCIESFLSGPGLAADHGRLHPEQAGLDGPEIVARAEAGEAEALATLGRYEERLARALAHVINLIDPDVIVLGGGLSRIERLYREVPRHWLTWVFSDHLSTRLLPPVHGDAGGVRGAAWLWPEENA